jgi:hypothetical protein
MRPKRQLPYQFVLDELESLRPRIKQAFGMTYVYLGERLLLIMRASDKLPATNGIWLYTELPHLDSLRRDFPAVPRHHFWTSGRNAWVILAASKGEFEEHAFKACELILNGDRRIGRITRGSVTRV